MLDEILNRAPNRHQPYVGASAFAHKGGLHVSAVQKDPRTYEHIPPEWVGNARHVLVSDQAGRSNILARLEAFGINLQADDPRVRLLLDQVKEREFLGYSYDGAEASFELLARRALGQVPEFFRVESFRVLVERRFDAMGRLKTVSEATVKLTIDGETFFSVGEGVGPVNALDQALRRDLRRYQRYIDDLELVDFKVRILTTGTEAVTRVLIESKDAKGKRWFTVGVSPNIVDASFEALADAITWKLFHDLAAERQAKAKAKKAL
jgi:2-isopropylmalate synthase